MAETGPKTKGVSSASKPKAPQSRIAAPQVPPAPKVLRIGIIQSGKIVEERIIRKRETVTIGQSEKNTFVVALPELPMRFDMFETKGGEYTLQFTESMGGRVSIKGEVKDLVELRTSGLARAKGKVFQIPLNDESRGKLVIGESTILFQFVAPPPIQPRPQLPAAVRGGPFRNIEWFITLVWLGSLLAHAGFLVYLQVADWPVVSKWEQYLELEELVTPREVTQEKEKTQVEDTAGTDEKDTGEEEKTPKKEPKKQSDQPQKSAAEIARERAERRAALAEQLAQRGINKILGSLGAGEGAVIDVLRNGDVAADQDELLAQVNGVGVATGSQNQLSGPAGGKGTGEAADIDQLRMNGGDATVRTAGAGEEQKIKAVTKRRNAEAIDGTGVLDPAEVNKIIGRRLGAITGCYERALRRDPNLKGKVVIQFTVSGTGKVSSAKATTNELTPEVGACIEDSFMRFRFPPPEGGSLTMEAPFFFTPAS